MTERALGRVLAVVMGAAALASCDARSLVPDGGGGGSSGSTGAGGAEKVSDFEDLAAATVVHQGTPPRNGVWYAYGDGSATCAQVPSGGATYVGEAPPTAAPSGAAGSLALHARWTGCATWGAGIGADLNVPLAPTNTGAKAPYDLTSFTGLIFWAMATPGTDPSLRVKLPMLANTPIEDGGACLDGADRCGDAWGETFTLPSNGNWRQVTVRFADPQFKQEGWGAAFYWNPVDVTSIQIQSVDRDETYDFWIDDVYLLR
jgi:hypothetical protein